MSNFYTHRLPIRFLCFCISILYLNQSFAQNGPCDVPFQQTGFLLPTAAFIPCGQTVSSPQNIINGQGATTFSIDAPSSCNEPTSNQDVDWKVFGAVGGSWDWQITATNGTVHYALYEVLQNPCNENQLVLVDCGSDFDTWTTISGTDPITQTLFYIAFWADDPSATDVTYQVNFREGCGGCVTINDCCLAYGGNLDGTAQSYCEGATALDLHLLPTPSDAAGIGSVYGYRYYVIDRSGGATDGAIVLVDTEDGGPDLSTIDVTQTTQYEVCGLSYDLTDEANLPTIGDSYDAFLQLINAPDAAVCAHSSETCTPITITSAPLADYIPAVNSSTLPICGQCTGSIVLGGFNSGDTYTITYLLDGNEGSFGPTTPNAFGEITLENLCSGTYQNFVAANASGCGVMVEDGENVELCALDGTTPTAMMNPPTSCTTANGVIVINGLLPSTTFSVTCLKDGVLTDFGTRNANINGSIIFFGLSNGTYDNFTIKNTITGCVAGTILNEPLVLEAADTPTTPTLATSIVACEDETIQFNVIEPATATGTTWQWTGPNGYSSTLYEPVIMTAQLSDSGTYTATMTQNGCTTEPVDVVVSVFEIPNQPQLDIPDAICTGDALTLGTSATCDRYYWIPPGETQTSVTGNPLLNTTTNSTTIPVGDAVYVEGMWTLVCLQNGCASPPSEPQEVQIGTSLATPNPILLGTRCAGNNVFLRTVNTYPTGTTFRWYDTDPALGNPAPVSQQAVYLLINIAAGEYTYWVQVEREGCMSEVVPVTFIIGALPDASPSHTGGDCGETLQLLANVNNTDNQVFGYEWEGPNNFQSTLINPTIEDPTEINNGTYSLTITNDNTGCAETFEIADLTVLTALDYTPTIEANTTSLCAGEMLELTTETYAGDDILYYWSIQNSTNTVTETTSDPMLSINAVEEATHTATYTVQVGTGDCRSALSNVLEVVVQGVPMLPPIAGMDTLCAGATLQLNTDAVTGATYSWKGPNNWTSDQQNPSIENVTAINAGVYNLFVEVDGCTSAVNDFLVTVNETPTEAILTSNSPVCTGETLLLAVENPDENYIYSWFSQTDNALLGTGTTLELPDATLDLATNYYVQVETPEACVYDSSSDNNLLTVNIVESVALEADAGADASVCQNIFTVAANSVANQTNVTGTWTSANETVIFQNDNAANTTVSGLQFGVNELVWTVNHELCSATATDTLRLEYVAPPVVENDSYTIVFGDSLQAFMPFENDNWDETYYLFDFSAIENGTVIEEGAASFTYIPNPNFSGEDRFFYTICSEICPNQCDEASVRVTVEAQSECIIPTAFTPNGDGVNDTFEIPCLLNGVVAELIVFNRWGDEVYRNSIYQNEWDGTYKGANLPTGTYFYVLEYEERGLETVRGYVYLQRE